MNSVDEKAGSVQAARSGAPWLNPRRARFWLIAVILLYALAGYLAVPVIAKHAVLGYIRDDLGRGARIADVAFDPFKLDLDVKGFELDDTDAVRLAAFDRLQVDFKLSSLWQRAWTFGEIRLTRPYVFFEQPAAGESRLSRLSADASRQEGEQAQAGDPAAAFAVGKLLVDHGEVDLADQGTTPPARAGVRELHVELSGIDSRNGTLMPLNVTGNLAEGGRFEVQGKLGLFPAISFKGSAHTHEVPLSLAQPYAQRAARVLIDGGVIDSNIKIDLQAEKPVDLAGQVSVSGLDLKDAIEKAPLLGWDKLDVDQFDLDTDGLKISRLDITGLTARVIVLPDRSTNLSVLRVEDKGPPAPADAVASAPGLAVSIGGIRIEGGDLAFSDLSLPLPFATRISKLSGTVSALATGSTEPANVHLEGQVDEYGLARIDGALDLLDPMRHMDLALNFRNLLMSSLTPYSIQFAGYKIDEGRLETNLQYSIDAGQLQAQNSLVISDLKLGEKVEQPGAANLPLALAVALLKDANGVIDIDVPVSGDVNDPEFKVGGVIRKALAGVITKVVGAPFRLLGKLIGIQSEDFGEFQFLAGRSDLTPPEMEKVTQLEKALAKRPQLVIEIGGVSDPAVDKPALQAARLSARLLKGIENAEGRLDDTMLLNDQVLTAMESLFGERFPDQPLAALKEKHTVAPADNADGAAVLDRLAYATDLRERLRAAEPISEQDLADLAQARAEAVRAAFAANPEFDQGRIRLTEPGTVKSKDGDWVKLELGVGAK